jgi:hypothetical protein
MNVIKKIVENRGHPLINILMAIGIIPYILSMLYGTVFKIFSYNLSITIAYIIPLFIVIILFIFKLCNPLTMAIGHILFFLFVGLIPIPIIWREYVLYYSMYMIMITFISAIFYYIFGYKGKSTFENIIMSITAMLILIIWYLVYKRL